VVCAAEANGDSFSSLAVHLVVEDDAQDGADHVDSHRSPAYVISPYTRRGVVDSTMYNTTSMLRTMELILGLKPMTVFDAGATPMANAFAQKADLRPYTNEAVPLNEKNPEHSATAERSEKLDFSASDMADEETNSTTFSGSQLKGHRHQRRRAAASGVRKKGGACPQI
jgi:phospholipase C